LADTVPVFPETQAICNHYHLNPMGLIASGALLIIVQANATEKVLMRIRSHGIAATLIGEVTDKRKGVKLLTADGVVDELTRI
jgi:hydrogenase expression/formation protein HypE